MLGTRVRVGACASAGQPGGCRRVPKLPVRAHPRRGWCVLGFEGWFRTVPSALAARQCCLQPSELLCFPFSPQLHAEHRTTPGSSSLRLTGIISQLPASFFAYRKQQHRWTCGPVQLWFKASRDIWASKLPLLRKLELILLYFGVRKFATHWVSLGFFCTLVPLSIFTPEVQPPPTQTPRTFVGPGFQSATWRLPRCSSLRPWCWASVEAELNADCLQGWLWAVGQHAGINSTVGVEKELMSQQFPAGGQNCHTEVQKAVICCWTCTRLVHFTDQQQHCARS